MEHATKTMQAALEIAATVNPNVHHWTVRQTRNASGTPGYPTITTTNYGSAETAEAIKIICDKHNCRYSAAPVQVGTTFNGNPSLATEYMIFEQR
jgi:hypothetical protein